MVLYAHDCSCTCEKSLGIFRELVKKHMYSTCRPAGGDVYALYVHLLGVYLTCTAYSLWGTVVVKSKPYEWMLTNTCSTWNSHWDNIAIEGQGYESLT